MRFYRSLAPIKAMTFDLDDTLYDNWPVITRVEQQAAQWLYQQHPISQGWDAKQWHECKMALLKADPALKHDVTQWRYQQIKQGLEQLGYDDLNATQAAQTLIEKVLIWRSDFDVPHETHRTLSVLSKQIPLVAITNGNVDVEKIGLHQYFDLILKAGPDGRAKPNSDMFDKAAQHLAVPRRHILHVGDHVVTDVAGAIRNGFSACWFNDKEKSARQTVRLKQLPDIEINHIQQLLELQL
ncbi:Flavin mononucleotide phosphatase YigB [Vibrio thalassae]|uniref:Flavin mononucleotide phosphatase YigB n=1 Tax=Vibrio thalassae TaxID=1243014 RepID=A0A240ERF9_9VIBR|nr:5-amino-6-(5-phospho-D-ribitylamino)uracil phosphatase YigB [Vibrio thalassae]SNX50969.1 Flavin mononucleotide phosphatase YigB [Vibrio thalassae]